MSFRQALVYFASEAARNLLRSWKTSALAILTISLSLFVGGLFVMITQNLTTQAERFGDQLLVTVYLSPDAAAADQQAMREGLSTGPWVASTRDVSSDEARRRFEQSFPSLADVFGRSDEAPFSASVEIELVPSAARGDAFDRWLEALRASPAVEMVDDDRDWLAELRRIIALVRGLGAGVGLGLLVAAVLTIASVIKLTAYLYLEEIRILRLVGATEFFIRGPFYVEGLMQGLVGGLLSVVGLFAAATALGARASDSFWLPFVAGEFLPLHTQLMLVATGAGAGLLGAVLSLRRESLRGDTDA